MRRRRMISLMLTRPDNDDDDEENSCVFLSCKTQTNARSVELGRVDPARAVNRTPRWSSWWWWGWSSWWWWGWSWWCGWWWWWWWARRWSICLLKWIETKSSAGSCLFTLRTFHYRKMVEMVLNSYFQVSSDWMILWSILVFHIAIIMKLGVLTCVAASIGLTLAWVGLTRPFWLQNVTFVCPLVSSQLLSGPGISQCRRKKSRQPFSVRDLS